MTRPWSLDNALRLSAAGFTDAQIAAYYGAKPSDVGHRLACAETSRANGRDRGSMVTRACAECRRVVRLRQGRIWGECCRSAVLEREGAMI